MSSTPLKDKIDALFEAERAARALHAEIVEEKRDGLITALRDATKAALAEKNEDEAAVRLSRLALVLGDLDGDDVVDLLIDILASDSAEARVAAGEALESLAFDRFKEVA